MDINQVPKQSGRLKLSDVDPYLIALEGPTDDETAAWVVIKVASTDDNRRRDDMLRQHEMRYMNRPDESLVFAEISKPTESERAEIAVYLTLADAGNINANGVPVFSSLPVKKMEYDAFLELWRSLPLDISRAIYMAVLAVNRAWSIE
jgi:hypothetical protein